jgi:hypothetical protein
MITDAFVAAYEAAHRFVSGSTMTVETPQTVPPPTIRAGIEDLDQPVYETVTHLHKPGVAAQFEGLDDRQVDVRKDDAYAATCRLLGTTL